MKRYIKGIRRRVKHFQNRITDVYQALFANQKSSLNRYCDAFPHPQNALNIFPDDWRSCFPPPFHELQAGETPLFDDLGVKWCINLLGGVENKKVLELGPLEGGHTYILQNAGAQSIVSIEAHPRAYLRCLIVKEVLKLNRAEFLFGDFMQYLRQSSGQFDLGLAVGVLYHMQQPVELLAKMADKCPQLYVWTHYYEEEHCKKFLLRKRFGAATSATYEGFNYSTYLYRYGSARKWSTFIGGPANTSQWLTREDILNCCYHFGYNRIDINFDQLNHPHGPCFSFVARKF